MRALIIETSTERGVIALVEGQKVLFSKDLPFGYNQSKFLMPELQAVVHSFHLEPGCLDCIAVGSGPGSYTGIRIGAAVAKSLSYAWRLPLVGFSSLQAFVPAAYKEKQAFAALIDAKISGAYILKGQMINGQIVHQSEPQVCPLDELQDKLEGVQLLVAPYCQSLLNKMDALYPPLTWEWEERGPSVGHLALVVEEKYRKGEYSSDGRLELLYLRKTEAELEKERLGRKI